MLPLAAIFDFTRAHGDGDRVVAWVARRQLGLITTAQLVAAGLGKDAITRRVYKGTLRRLHQGVYLLGQPPLLPGAPELAAVLACGEHAFVSHRSAAAIWGLAPAPADVVELTLVGRPRRQRPCLRTYLVADLDPAERRLRAGIRGRAALEAVDP